MLNLLIVGGGSHRSHCQEVRQAGLVRRGEGKLADSSEVMDRGVCGTLFFCLYNVVFSI